MHILERYALGAGAQIDRPCIYEKFYPLDFDKYITLHPRGKYESRSYDLWQEVLALIHEPLSQKKIHIVQIGVEDDPVLPLVFRTSGTTSLSQVAYIIKNSILHVGVDSFPVHIASHYDKKIVALYPNVHPSVSRPYWGDKKDHVLIEPNRHNSKPTYSAEENPKTINSISPEKIARNILNLLKINHNIYNETIYCGKLYSTTNLIYETTLDKIVDSQSMNLSKILCRMDFNHNEKVLEKQLGLGLSEIITESPIDMEILEKYKNNIKGIIYKIDKDDDPSFAEGVFSLGIEIALISELPPEELAPKKINYMDLGIIREIKTPDPKNNELKGIDLNKLYYKSNKFTLSSGKIYPSKWAWKNGLDIKNKEELSEVPDEKEFWQESNNFCFLLETS